VGDGRYWSLEHCDWAASPGTDALATPWSAHGLPLPDPAPPGDGFDVAGVAKPAPDLPGQRRPRSPQPAPIPPT
jgi:hypothetical protein